MKYRLFEGFDGKEGDNGTLRTNHVEVGVPFA